MFDGKGVIIDWLNVSTLTKQKTDWVRVPGRNFHSLTFRQSGKVLFQSGGVSLTSTPNTVTFIPRGITYDTAICTDMDMLVVHFTSTEELPHLKPMVIHPSYPVVIRNLFLALVNRYSIGREQDYVCMSILYELLAELSMEISFRRPVPARMLEAREYMDEHFNEDIRIAALAEKANVGETYFRREFRMCFDCAPVVYLKNVRLENARILLESGLYTISETAGLCGFHSVSYLSKEFSRKFGMSPREYMNK